MYRSVKVLLMCLFVLAPLPALASTIYTLNIDGSTGGLGPAPYATIALTQAGANTVHFVVDLTPTGAGLQFVLTGNAAKASTIGFNIAGANPTVSFLNPSLTGWTLQQGLAGGYSSNGVFGSFEYSLNCCSSQNGGSNAQAGPLSFDLTAPGLTVAQFQTLSNNGNNPGAYFVIDLLGNTGTGNPATGYVGVRDLPVDDSVTPAAVPEPTSLLLIGAGLAGLGLFRRKF